MAIKLIKRDQQPKNNNEPPKAPSIGRLIDSTQAWVDEYKERKARTLATLTESLRSQ
ncbi:MAG: hypothetical protein L0229_10190 [Blastocatellia bacterium]|nr:hypothetical protein [Blastocatellia bacterium]